jgi:hypothetical protein
MGGVRASAVLQRRFSRRQADAQAPAITCALRGHDAERAFEPLHGARIDAEPIGGATDRFARLQSRERSCKLRPSRSTDQAMTISNLR